MAPVRTKEKLALLIVSPVVTLVSAVLVIEAAIYQWRRAAQVNKWVGSSE
jgi:hypothetical protein